MDIMGVVLHPSPLAAALRLLLATVCVEGAISSPRLITKIDF